MFFSKRQKGQGLVEFALILPILLMVVLGLIETALLFQAYLAIQHGAREAARFAVSMQPPMGHMITEDGIEPCPAGGGTDKWGVFCEGPDENESDLAARREKWQRRRVQMIKARALEASMGVRVREDKLRIGLDEQDDFHVPEDSASYDDYWGVPGFYGVQVRGFSRNEEGELGPKWDHPSLPGLHVRVIVYHRAEVIDPLMGAIVDSVMLNARMDMINEGLQAGAGPLPTFEPETPPDLGPGPEPEPNDPPNRPVNRFPEDGATEETGNPQFTWEYSDPDGDPQSDFRVQLWPQGDSVSHDSGEFPGEASTFTPDDWNLSSGEYCWHVSVGDDHGLWSEYSAATCFWVQVEDNSPPDRPVNESPVEAGTCVTIDTAHPRFTWSDFSDPDGDTQSYLQIRLRASGAGHGDSGNSWNTDLVASDASAYTPPWYLDDGEYYWGVRVRDNRGLWSSYSLDTCFIVNAAPYLFVLGDHEEGDPFVLREEVTVVIGKHDADTDYELWWVRPDDAGRSFASVTSNAQGYYALPWSLTDLTDPSDWQLIPGGGTPGQVYTCTVQSRDPASGEVVASQEISVLVPEELPDLWVTGITLPDRPLANVPMTITVGIKNETYSTVEGFFDVNVYVDPERPPTQGRPGDSLQWVDGIGPEGTRTMTFVITLVGLGDHEVWAYVDATNAVDEEHENNNYDFELTFAGCEE